MFQLRYGRPSLALDLIEPFRHPVADRLVLKLVNLRVLEAVDFQRGGEGHGVFLSPKPMKRYFEEYERWMLHLPAEVTGTDAAAKPDGTDRADAAARPGFREAIRTEVEKLCMALRRGEPFVPWRFEPAVVEAPEDKKGAEGEGSCNTSSVTT